MNTPRSRTALTGQTSVLATESGWLGSCGSLLVDAHHITSVLSLLSWRPLERIQLAMLSRHCDTVVENREVASDRHEPYIWLPICWQFFVSKHLNSPWGPCQIKHFQTKNAPNVVWRPGSARTCWGSLQRSPDPQLHWNSSRLRPSETERSGSSFSHSNTDYKADVPRNFGCSTRCIISLVHIRYCFCNTPWSK